MYHTAGYSDMRDSIDPIYLSILFFFAAILLPIVDDASNKKFVI